MCSEREENFGKPIRDQLFNDARVPWSEYHYYDPKTVGFDFDGMIFDIKGVLLLSCSVAAQICSSYSGYILVGLLYSAVDCCVSSSILLVCLI
ncbi:hypothetical protein ACSBR2_018673 [Camellia fascicularis]